MQPLSDWVKNLSGMDIPVLRRTAQDIQRLRGKQESVTARDLSQIVLRDPLMTLKVLRFSQSRLTRRQATEVTTVEHALMMHGLASFFREMGALTELEQQLAAQPEALEGALRVISRACHAANNARNFAAIRHDMDSDELVTGALLHDLAELLLWLAAPAEAKQIEYMIDHQRGLRSVAAQRGCLGFALADLQLALTHAWNLPSLLQSLMDDKQANLPRVQTVASSVAVARHSAHDWYDPALPDDYKGLQKLLNLPLDGVLGWVRQSAVQAARNWGHTGIRPAAAWIPLLPGEWPAEQGTPNIAGKSEAAAALHIRVLNQLAQITRGTGEAELVAAIAFYAFNAGLGLRRLWFGRLNDSTRRVQPWQTLLLDPGLLPGELTFELGSTQLFGRLMGKVQGIWFGGSLREKLMPLVPQGLRPRFAARDFFAMSLYVKDRPFGMLYADGGAGAPQLDEQRYGAFKDICVAAGKALERMAV
jgi:HD-like signal output (HDOD) protein